MLVYARDCGCDMICVCVANEGKCDLNDKILMSKADKTESAHLKAFRKV